MMLVEPGGILWNLDNSDFWDKVFVEVVVIFFESIEDFFDLLAGVNGFFWCDVSVNEAFCSCGLEESLVEVEKVIEGYFLECGDLFIDVEVITTHLH